MGTVKCGLYTENLLEEHKVRRLEDVATVRWEKDYLYPVGQAELERTWGEKTFNMFKDVLSKTVGLPKVRWGVAPSIYRRIGLMMSCCSTYSRMLTNT